MGETHVWVVGDCFARFTGNENVMTTSEVSRWVRSHAEPDVRGVVLHPALGVDRTMWRELARTVSRAGLEQVVLPEGAPAEPVGRHTVLKQQQDNVLIGEPHVSGNEVAGALLVPNDTEMLRDHTADQQHIPGMLLIEAVTQLITWAVGETVPPIADGTPRYAVMHHLRTEFHRFVFPLPAVLRARLTRDGEATDERVPLTARVDIEQAERVTTVCEIELNAFDPNAVFTVEAGQAAKTVRHTTPLEGVAA
ncbi:A-factor biosynthesis hotdog domain-containing protein [Actinopolyspora lacussalsi subsp. righensis]|uniref:A-factor biosynthesis hotdog domain-containing protein n=1 Tax=Actinopolyspora righensis TaxID=995060 RepID=A0A1I6XBQ4_9ACTN|nr:AfsA-related hotdog domain-containing protein [Actinopolyspora righensis]SFT35606.1 A-factor biosynthesis hotdog domain-containing protein [Actinopolyspora righensis]